MDTDKYYWPDWCNDMEEAFVESDEEVTWEVPGLIPESLVI